MVTHQDCPRIKCPGERKGHNLLYQGWLMRLPCGLPDKSTYQISITVHDDGGTYSVIIDCEDFYD